MRIKAIKLLTLRTLTLFEISEYAISIMTVAHEVNTAKEIIMKQRQQ